jgi:hypothetical protein
MAMTLPPDYPSVVAHVQPWIGVIGVGAARSGLAKSESDSSGGVEDQVVLDQGPASPIPEVNGMLGDLSVLAVDAIKGVGAHHPVLRRMDIQATRVAPEGAFDVLAARRCHGQLRTRHGTVVDECCTSRVRVHLHELLASVDEVKAM